MGQSDQLFLVLDFTDPCYSSLGTLVSTGVFILLLGAVAVNVVITFRNAYVQELLTIGWGPLFIAMIISR